MRALAFIAAAIVVTGPAAAQESTQVSINDNTFTPHVVEIRPGGTVLWEYSTAASRPHTVSSQPGSPEQWDSGNLDPASRRQFSRAFNSPGTYPYYCKIHGQPSPTADPNMPATSQPCAMCGIVRVIATTVTAAPTPARTPSPRPAARVTPAPADRPAPSPTPEQATPTPTAQPFSPSPTSTSVAAPRSTGRGSAAPAVAAGLAAFALGGAAYVLWRRRAMGA